MPDYRLGRLKGTFVVVFDDERGRHRYRLGTSNPAEARSRLREFAAERDRLVRPPNKLTIAEIYADYVADRKAEGKSTERQENAWKRLSPDFSLLGADHVSPDLVRAYIRKRREHKAGDGTIHTELGYLRAALRKALGPQAPSIRLPPKPRPRSRYLTPDEAKRLIDAAGMPHLRLFMLLALYTGGRPGALLDLSWQRVDFSSGRISLDNPGRDRTAKGRATVPMADAIRDDLRQAHAAALTDHVIEWAGKPVGSVKKGIARAAQRAGLEGVTPYVLRHTAARWMVEGGVPIVEVAQYLGHTSPNVTFRVYGRYSPEYLRRAGDAIAANLHSAPRSSEPNTVNLKRTKKDMIVNTKEKKRPKR